MSSVEIAVDPKVLRLEQGATSDKVAFQIVYRGENPLDAVLRVRTDAASVALLIRFEGQGRRTLSAAEPQSVSVTVKVPEEQAPGQYSFRLAVMGVEDPDQQYFESPPVSVDVYAPAAEAPSPPAVEPQEAPPQEEAKRADPPQDVAPVAEAASPAEPEPEPEPEPVSDAPSSEAHAHHSPARKKSLAPSYAPSWLLPATLGIVLLLGGIGLCSVLTPKAEASLGEACSSSMPCGEGLECSRTRTCVGRPGFAGCSSDGDCSTGQCSNGTCG